MTIVKIFLRILGGTFLFLLGPNQLMLATRLDPYPGLFWQCVGCISAAFLSWLGGTIMRDSYIQLSRRIEMRNKK